jgi:SAM-dependent methyltransferase
MADAYSLTGAAWQAGPGRIYDRLARVLVAACPGGIAGRRVVDLGAGTGAASRAALAAGAACVIAVDLAAGMLTYDAGERPAGVVADLRCLPLTDGGVGAVVAAFSINHLPDPVEGLCEVVRVLEPGGAFVASAYAVDDTHPVKAAADAACTAWGWQPDEWYADLRAEAMPQLSTPERAVAAANAAGMTGATAERRHVAFPELGPADLVAWRLGMAQVAAFMARLDDSERAELQAEAVRRMGPSPPTLRRSFVTLSWRRSC